MTEKDLKLYLIVFNLILFFPEGTEASLYYMNFEILRQRLT